MTSRRATQRRRDLERRAPTRPVLARVAGGVDVDQEDASGELVSFAGVPLAVEEHLARALTRELEESPDRNLVGYGWTAFHHARQVEVPERLRRGVVVGAGKPAWCFEGAAAYAAAHVDQDVTLVHAIILEAGWPFTHALVLLEDQAAVYDPSSGRFYDWTSYREMLRPLPLATYPAGAAVRLLEQTGHPGPWDDYNTRHDLLVELWITEIEASAPGLEAWIDAMLAADPGFAAVYRRLVLANALAAVAIHAHLAEHPERWQSHRPGCGSWPWPVHPLGDQWDTPEQPGQRATLGL